jgi:class 3 adenylate cyclase/tetratricopeptide (TPR) repeat protein
VEAAERPGVSQRPGPAAERRLVTVLFADLVGFTPYSEERDPEETRELLSRYYDTTRAVVERHGGTVEKFIGDAVMAAWGTPVAHEDDAERAVRAGLGVVDAVRGLGHGLDARVGVLTGEAAVTLGATNEGMVAGDLVNTAARLQGVAPPGAVLVGEATMRAASAAIAFEPAGQQHLKGKTAPLPAWLALRVVAERGGQGRTEGLEPPFVGRDEELRTLKDLLHATGRERRVRLVSVTGPAGIGKSRLAWELEKYVDGIVDPVFWHRGRSPAYGEGLTFWALGEMVRRRAGLAEGDDDEATRDRLATMVAELVPDEADRRWVEPSVLTLLGLEPPPPGGRDVLFAGWRILFERIAGRGTAVLVFEDLHWADSGLLDFIEHVVTVVKGLPILIVTLARPELFDHRPDWGAGVRDMTAIDLEPLTEPAMRALLEGLVQDLPPNAVRAILARAEGIPLYAVETVRGLLADGRIERTPDGVLRPVGDLDQLAVPETLRSLVAARLDGLPAADRSLVLDGAVLGKTFSVAAIAAVAGEPEADVEPRLQSLVRRELFTFETDPRSPERGQYGFVQALVREVAYATLSKRDRRTRHLAVARHFEALGDPELAGALADHYLAAHGASAEGPETEALAAQARLALRSAADRAIDLGAYAQALAFLDRARSVSDQPSERAALLERAALVAPGAGRYEVATEAATSAIEVYRSVGSVEGIARTSAVLASIQIESSRLEGALGTVEAALAELPSEGADELRADLEARRARALLRSGRHEESLAAADRALALAERGGIERIVAEGLVNKGSALGLLGRWREGAALVRASIDFAERTGELMTELRARNNLAATLWPSDQSATWDLALANFRLARRVGHRAHLVWTAAVIAFYDYELGRDWDGSIARLDELLEDATALERLRLLANRLTVMIDREEAVDDMLAEEVALVAHLSDPDFVAGPTSHAAQRVGIGGDHAGGARGFLAAAEGAALSAAQLCWEAGLHAALAADRDLLAAARARLGVGSGYAAMMPGIPQALEAAVEAVDGRPTEAERLFSQAFGNLAVLDYDRARAELVAVRLLPEAAKAAAWADDARIVFERCRTPAHLRWLDEAVSRMGTRRPAASGVAQPVR